MTKILVSIFATFAFSFASASTVPVNPTLQGDMKMIATTYEKLGKQIDNKKKNQSSKQLANRMLDASASAQAKTPPGAEKLEGPAKDEMIKKYQADVQGMIDHLIQLRDALKKGDNKEARVHYDALKPLARPGHETEYK